MQLEWQHQFHAHEPHENNFIAEHKMQPSIFVLRHCDSRLEGDRRPENNICTKSMSAHTLFKQTIQKFITIWMKKKNKKKEMNKKKNGCANFLFSVRYCVRKLNKGR